jgi:cystathionine beta-lyase/cystathionine gamma-synthase
MSDETNLRIETLAVHAGQAPDPTTGAVMTPVYLNSTYAQPAPGELIAGHDYSRSINPTRTALEKNLAALEGARWGVAFASGMAAIGGMLSRLEAGDHVVAGNDLYGGTYRIFLRCFQKLGIEFTLVDATELDEVRDAIGPRTKYVYVETPTNPLLRVIDIAGCAEIAHAAGAKCVVDNTFATPYLQRPLDLGADLVIHSLTKYLGGHSDVVAGAAVGNDEELGEEMLFHMNAIGGQLGPMDAFLVLRGAKTLHLRMQRHCENATALATHLEASELVERVFYPGLPSHPQHIVAARQMSGFGGMVSFELAGGVPAGVAFSKATRVFTLAESLGGVESLVEVPPIMTHASIPAEERRKAGLADGLVRLSVGVEHVEDLLADVERGLAAALAAR